MREGRGCFEGVILAALKVLLKSSGGGRSRPNGRLDIKFY